MSAGMARSSNRQRTARVEARAAVCGDDLAHRWQWLHRLLGISRPRRTPRRSRPSHPIAPPSTPSARVPVHERSGPPPSRSARGRSGPSVSVLVRPARCWSLAVQVPFCVGIRRQCGPERVRTRTGRAGPERGERDQNGERWTRTGRAGPEWVRRLSGGRRVRRASASRRSCRRAARTPLGRAGLHW